jgi:branched-chain amino acid transport system permease protein
LLEYVLAGLALGSVYAIASSSLAVTYVSAGILNFAFGSLAYVLARFFYYLNTEHGLAAAPALLITLVGAGPLVGYVLWLLLFRQLRHSSQIIKIVATIGVSVALPPIATLLFGTASITQAPGLATEPVRVYRFLGVSVTLDQLIVFGAVVVVLVLGVLVLHYTDAGLRVRALVNSEALSSLSGMNPSVTSAGVWMVSASLAGLAGILVAPTSGLTLGGMTSLMSVAFAAVLAARLRSIPLAVAVSLTMGLITEIIQKYLPADSSLTSAVVPSIPFAVMAVFLVVAAIRGDSLKDSTGSGSGLDAAIRSQDADATVMSVGGGPDPATSVSPPRLPRQALPFVILACVPLLTNGYWLTLTASGIAFGVIYLSYTLVTGEGGLIWLCQSSFAGGGAIATAQLASVEHWPVVPSIFVGALLITPVGMAIALLTVRLGDLYVALATLSFGLLAETLIFTRNRFYQGGVGVLLDRPGFLSSDRAFCYFGLVVFAVLGLVIVNLRRSTAGLALSAVRWSEPGAKTLGISVVKVKVMVSALATFVCAVGGGVLALDTGSAIPDSFETFLSLTWLATVVTIGIRSVTGALVAGIGSSLLLGLFQTYLPKSLGDVPTLLFGLGAILVVRFPDGQGVETVRQVEALVRRLTGRRRQAGGLTTRPVGGFTKADTPKQTAPREVV